MNLPFFSISSIRYGELSFSPVIPDLLKPHLLPGAESVAAYCPSGSLLFQEISGEDHSAWYHTILLQQDDRFILRAREPVLAMHFFLQNTFLLSEELTQEPLAFHEGQYNMSYLSSFSFIADFPKDKVYKCLTLSYSPYYLSRVAEIYPSMSNLSEKVHRHAVAHLCPNNKIITEEMKRCIHTLLHESCKEPEMRRVIQKGKALEILVQVLEHADRDTAFTGPVLTKQDSEKIYAAKEYLDQHADAAVTLFELARKVGLNVHKLSTGFLQIVGTTVFYYHRQVRMNKAIQLLEDTNRNLFDIGTEVGYYDGKSFSKEFKKFKGVTPFEYRRHLRPLKT